MKRNFGLDRANRGDRASAMIELGLYCSRLSCTMHAEQGFNVVPLRGRSNGGANFLHNGVQCAPRIRGIPLEDNGGRTAGISHVIAQRASQNSRPQRLAPKRKELTLAGDFRNGRVAEMKGFGS